MSDAIIQMNELSHYYGSFKAVQDVNLDVQHGEIFGFLGPNGAGKTTTIRTLLDFIRPSTGSASIFGLDTRKNSVEIRQRLGYMPSELKLWENWTGAQYIGWLERVRGGKFLEEAMRLADRLDYDLMRSLQGMSTGMKRKMGLIAALAHKPELLILDEPTTGLDPLMQQVFHDFMLETRDEGRTVFLSSHNLQEVETLCDRVGIIREGRLQAVETVSNLTKVTFRWLTIETEGGIDYEGFEAIPGISDIEVTGSEILMRVSGHTSMDALIKQMAQHTVVNMRFENPTLEEIFLSYYGESSRKHKNGNGNGKGN